MVIPKRYFSIASPQVDLSVPAHFSPGTSSRQVSFEMSLGIEKAICLCMLVFQLLCMPAFSAETNTRAQNLLSLDTLVSNWLKRTDLNHSTVGIEVMELPSGRILYSLNNLRRFVPASTQKVLTTACAFDTLGGAYKYKTRLYTFGKLSGKKIQGDVILAPAEDPSFGRQDLEQLFSTLSHQGLTEIEGNIRLNPIEGGIDTWNSGWLTEDWGQQWMPPSSNLVVDRNMIQGNFILKGFRVNNLGPDTANNAMAQCLLTSGDSAAWVECDLRNHQLNYFRSPGMNNGAPLVVANPSDFNCALSESIACQLGIKVNNRNVHTVWPVKEKMPTLLAEHESIPLWTIIRITLHESDNLYAQQLLRTLGLAKENPEPNPKGMNQKVATNWQAEDLQNRGLSKLTSWLTRIGVSAQEVVLSDGCGLSRKNGISPHTLNTVLRYMSGEKLNGPYLALLKRNNPSGKGTFAYKTGTMDTVRSITGVLQTIGGQTCAVTVMVNGHEPSVRSVSAEVNNLISLLDSIKTIKVLQQPGHSIDSPNNTKFAESEKSKTIGNSQNAAETLVELGNSPTNGTFRHSRHGRTKRHQ